MLTLEGRLSRKRRYVLPEKDVWGFVLTQDLYLDGTFQGPTTWVQMEGDPTTDQPLLQPHNGSLVRLTGVVEDTTLIVQTIESLKEEPAIIQSELKEHSGAVLAFKRGYKIDWKALQRVRRALLSRSTLVISAMMEREAPYRALIDAELARISAVD